MSDSNEEVELKAGVDAATLARLRRHPALRQATLGRPITRKLLSIYYDAEDLRLMQARLFLRMRNSAGQWEQTVKAGRRAALGMQRVTEATSLVCGPTPDLNRIPEPTLREAVARALGGADLEPACRSEIQRTTRILDTDAGRVELAFDRGQVVAGDSIDKICEVEIECLGGGATAAWDWAQLLLGAEAARLMQPSKAARGFTLAGGGQPLECKPVHGNPGILGAQPDADTAFANVLALLAPTIAENLYCVMSSHDPGGAHQLRVALRCLRALLRLFDGLVSLSAMNMGSRARDIGRIVGQLRDADVLTEALRVDGTPDGHEALNEALLQWREAVRAEVRAALRATRATGFVIDLLRLADERSWRPKKKAKRKQLKLPLFRVIAPALDAHWAKTYRHGKHFDDLTDSGRHQLRKDLKMFRYMLDVAALDEESPTSTRAQTALENLQHSLGALNDAENLANSVVSLKESRHSHALNERVTWLQSKDRVELRRELEQARREWRRLCKHWPLRSLPAAKRH